MDIWLNLQYYHMSLKIAVEYIFHIEMQLQEHDILYKIQRALHVLIKYTVIL
jgi:hypothetical protein